MPRKGGLYTSSQPWAGCQRRLYPTLTVCNKRRQCGPLPPDPNPSAKLNKGLEKGPSPNARWPLTYMQWHEWPERPAPQVGSTEETMDVCGPAQEQETSGSGTRAKDELIRQTSKGKQRDGMPKPRSEGFGRRKPTRTGWLPSRLEGGSGRGRDGGLSFVSRGEALRRGLTVGSCTGERVTMTSPARPQMPPAGRPQRVGARGTWSLRPQDLTAQPSAGPPPASGQRQKRVAGGGTMGPDRALGGCPGTREPRSPPWACPRRQWEKAKPPGTCWLTKTRRAARQTAPALPILLTPRSG